METVYEALAEGEAARLRVAGAGVRATPERASAGELAAAASLRP